jgi:pimeloyl-ACP methyl ester carboxylesterase
MRKFNGHFGLKERREATDDDGLNNVEAFYFKGAVVDNFAPVNEQTHWSGPEGTESGQRYWVNPQFFKGNGAPIFVFIGGEGAESASRLTSRMYAFDLAEQYDGLLIDLEHRFYGQSYPTEDMSNRNLKYLSSEQALADLARFITWFKNENQLGNSPVITIGGSYPGNLAAWFRLKYPHISDGSIASSAPVRAHLNFEEYMEVVGNSIVYFGGQACYDAFEVAANEVERYLNLGRKNKLHNDFQTCQELVSGYDVAVFQSSLMGNIQGAVQYNNEHSGVLNVSNLCDTMLTGIEDRRVVMDLAEAIRNGNPISERKETKQLYENFATVSNTYLESYGEECLDVSFVNSVKYLANPEFDGSSAMRQWFYQTCREFGYFQTTTSQESPFHAWSSLSLELFETVCSSIYRFDLDPDTDWTNAYYGASDLTSSKTVLPNGNIDPWHALGSYKTIQDADQFPLLIDGTAHCADLYAPANSDPQSLTDARANINKLVGKWIREASA